MDLAKAVATRTRIWRAPAPEPLANWFQAEFGVSLPSRVAVAAPHADDAELAMAATIAWLASKGVQVSELLIWRGTRAPGFDDLKLPEDRKWGIRRHEAEAACDVTGAKLVALDLEGYELKYAATDADCIKLVEELTKLQPQVLFVPPRFDSEAHQMVRGLMARGILQAALTDCRVVSYESPWNPTGGESPPTHYFEYDEDLAELKDLALSQFASQIRQIDYVSMARTNAQTWVHRMFELANGHHQRRTKQQRLSAGAGIEVFRVEQFDPDRAVGVHNILFTTLVCRPLRRVEPRVPGLVSRRYDPLVCS